VGEQYILQGKKERGWKSEYFEILGLWQDLLALTFVLAASGIDRQSFCCIDQVV
jgi:hypothetical protein